MIRGLMVFAMALSAAQLSWAAPPPCKGSSKSDPGCEEPVQPPAESAAAVDSVTVDWFNQALVVRGSGFSGLTEFLLGGNPTLLATANVTDSVVELPFDATLAAEATTQGNYNLWVDGAIVLSVYIEAAILDPAATGCPCEADWAIGLGNLWDPVDPPGKNTDCYEIEGLGSNDLADISGTVLSNAGDPTVCPQYPIGASFYPGQPNDSYCALVQVNGDASTSELVNLPINELQQADCADALYLNVCGTVTPLP
jgi:hypothetical protein